MSARILAGRRAMSGTFAAGILLAGIAARLHPTGPRAPLLLIGVAVAVTPGLLLFDRVPVSSVLARRSAS